MLIDNSDELWVGYAIENQLAGDHPAGIDSGPALAGFGDMISLDGITWEPMSIAYGLDYNWCLMAYVVPPDDGVVIPGPILLTQKPINNKNNELSRGYLEPAENPSFNFNGRAGLEGYNIYRNDELIVETGLETNYLDSGLDPGTYFYEVAARYLEGISARVGFPEIIFSPVTSPVINVDPLYVDEILDIYNMSTQYVTISNFGNGELTYDITVNFLSASPTPSKLNPEKYNPALCIDGLYTDGCSLGDGLVYWDFANVTASNIPCSGPIYDWYHDYTDQVHGLESGVSYEITVVAGYSDTYFDVWIDYNNDLYYDNSELILNDAFCDDANISYTFPVYIPASAATGESLLRFRTNWQATVEESCETYSYGNCCDFSVEMNGGINDDWLFVYPLSGTVAADSSDVVTLDFNSFDLEYGLYGAELLIASNDTVAPLIIVPVTLNVHPDHPEIFLYPDEFYFEMPGAVQDTQIMEIHCGGCGDLYYYMEITYGDSSYVDDWLSVDPVSGIVPNGSIDSVDIMVSTQGLYGISNYNAIIWVSSSSPFTPLIEVPVYLDIVGIDHQEKSYIMMYPNPAKTTINISANDELKRVQILGQLGRVLIEQNVSGKVSQIDISHLKQGSYFVKINSMAGESIQKLIID